jgi:hypothetical protein
MVWLFGATSIDRPPIDRPPIDQPPIDRPPIDQISKSPHWSTPTIDRSQFRQKFSFNSIQNDRPW